MANGAADRRLLATGWSMLEGFEEAWTRTPHLGPQVMVPHSALELPWNYGDERRYQKPFTYQRLIPWEDGFAGQDVRLHVEAAMADAHVWLNGALVARHADGYTPFDAPLGEHLQPGDNLVTIRVDGTENPAIPPFGGRIDYLTYAGLYRDIWLEVRHPVSLASVKVEVDDPLGATPVPRITLGLHGADTLPKGSELIATITGPDGVTASRALVAALEAELPPIHAPRLWSLDDPALYTLTLTLDGRGTLTTRFGLREARFTPEGFRLNGEPLKIRGLNRHQSFAHVGYALGPEAQARDADILKFELGLNLVRTSHYPQSKAFLDRCDEIGLLVFEEVPGWQHIGGDAFKAQTLANVEAMIRRDWNHPSIILWGVRINESPDDDAFYARTNALARRLDPTRQTGGVRCIPNSHLLEDVYTMNDFVLGEEHLPEFLQSRINRPRTPLRDQREVTGLADVVPYLVTEYNGHMYPTKIFDGEERQEEHVMRHLEVLDAAAGDPHIAGSIGWCMADYNTHADFGSGDRICYHGVMSMGRAPKFAAHAYASQGFTADERPNLEPATHWSFGDRKVGGVFPLVILTNCDTVTFHYGTDEPLTFQPAWSRFPSLRHPPVIIEATDLPEEKRIVWGQSWRDGLFAGFVNGRQVIERRLVADSHPTSLDVDIAPIIRAGDAYHDRLVRITARDQVGNRLPFLMDQIALTVSGGATFNGPATIPLIGGVAGTYIRQRHGEAAGLTLTPLSGILAPVEVTLEPSTQPLPAR